MLNAAFCTENSDRTIQDAQGALNFYCEVDVSRRINDIDSMALPVCSGRGRGNRDTSFLFLRHPVHCSSTVVCLTDFTIDTCIEQDTLGRGCLTCVNVGHYADITSKLKRYISWHNILLALVNIRTFRKHGLSRKQGVSHNRMQNTVPFAGAAKLPPVMCKRLVGLCHFVGILALFHRTAGSVNRVDDFAC